jgi:hypothetical protein
MDDQYLWDSTGTPDAEVARLEAALGRLKHVPTEAPWPTKPVVLEQRSRAQWLWLAGAAAVAAAIVLFLLRPGTPADTPHPVAAPAAEAPAKSEEPDALSAPRAILDHEEHEETGDKPRKILEKPGKKRPEEVDCEADPSHAECRGLPKRLTIEQVKQGFAKVMAKAVACGPKHGAEPGTKVKIKVMIVGATGKVSSAKAQGPRADTKLAWCVEDAAREARFPRFAKKYMGVLYPFVMSAKREREEAGEERRILEDLPDDLTLEQVIEGFAKVNEEVRACGPKHGAEPGTAVTVKVTIEGASGKVRTAKTFVRDKANPKLGRCVADAARKARFPRFAKEETMVLYPFTM